MKNIVLCLVGFSEINRTALLRMIELMSKKHVFDYVVLNEPEKADVLFFENIVPKDFPKDLTAPQLIISNGATYFGCRENQHRIAWGAVECQIGLIANIFKHIHSQKEDWYKIICSTIRSKIALIIDKIKCF